MRVALGIHTDSIDEAIQTYNLMSEQYFIHATPTLFHAGTPRPQLSSCFLLGTGDSVDSLYKTITDCAKISKWAGGIGLHISNVRAKNSFINSTNGKSNGILPYLRVLNETAKHINQSGKRNGSVAVYLEPWHADIYDFIEAKRPHGSEDFKARDLFYALWIPDLFMKRVQENTKWSIMCPNECPGLTDTYGEEFNKLYTKYESEGKYHQQVDAQKLWFKILDSQIETGTPYILYKDACNEKSNQKNLGVIKSSNLCTEIIEYSNDTEYAVCNLGSIGLPKFITETSINEKITVYSKDGCEYCDKAVQLLKDMNLEYTLIKLDSRNDRIDLYTKIEDDTDNFVDTMPQIYFGDTWVGGYTELCKKINKYTFDYEKLYQVTKILTRILNKVIDINFYPVEETKKSNLKHRPIGIGVQGLIDTFIKMRFPFESSEAKELNKQIFETIYYAALTASCEIAQEKGKTYESYPGCPISKGILQFDMWGVKPSDRWDWDKLRDNIKTHGIYNSLLVAPMPTASTSQIMGYNECFEPYTNNVYTRRTLAGEFIIVNKYLVEDLSKLGLWDVSMKDRLVYYNGSCPRYQRNTR